MRLYSYVVARDFGFAPNPFFGFSTLATCKPIIRRTAKVGDWIVGTGSKNYQLEKRLVFAMKVAEVMTYDQYWADPRFQQKKPNLRGSLKHGYGDNIYHRDLQGRKWLQEDSHHSHDDGTANPLNVRHDTSTNKVLAGSEFVYFGGFGPQVPSRFHDICAKRGHKCNFPEALVAAFVEWIESLPQKGYSADPAEF